MYIGKEPIVGNFQKCDAISVVNGQAAYTLQVSSTNVVPESANHMLVSLNGILQAPVTSFTVSGSTLTFASNLATGDVIDFVILLGNVLDLGTVSDGTIATAKIVDGAVTSAKLSAGKILQVVSTTKSDTFTATNLAAGAVSDITGLSVNITPISTSNKVLVFYSVQGVSEASSRVVNFATTLKRADTQISIADAASARIRVTNFISIRADANDQNVGATVSYNYLDSPSSTSSLTYEVGLKNIQDSALTYHVNRTYGDADDDNYRPRATSSITVMEVAG